MAKTTLRFLKRSRFPEQHEPIEVGTTREFEVGEESGQMHPDVLDSLLRGTDPMAEELDAAEVAALRKAEAKAAAKAKAAADDEEGKVPPKPAPKKPAPKAPAKASAKPKDESKSEPEGGAAPEA